MSKNWIKILLGALFLLSAAALAVGAWRAGVERKHQQAIDAAEALYEEGHYAEAKEAFLALEMGDRAEDCDEQTRRLAYEAAQALLAKEHFAEAKEAFRALGDYRDAAEMLTACDFVRAGTLVRDGNYADALRLLTELGDYPGAAELIDQVREMLYAKALEATYACRMDEAIALWNDLGDYRDSLNLRQRCQERIVHVAEGTDEPVNYSEYAGADIGTGTLYWTRVGQVFVPRNPGPETRCLIFFPGGYDESLPNAYMGEMIYDPTPPNAIMLFVHSNGFYSMADKVEDCYQALEQAAIKHNIFLHDLVLLGASNGAYIASRAAAWLYENHGLPASCVMTFDAGSHWAMLDYFLTPEECSVTAGIGTRFMLLEESGIGMNVRAIELLVAHGNNVTVARCVEDGHEQIIYDAIRYGMVDWALGEGQLPNNANYSYHPLDPSSTYPVGD